MESVVKSVSPWSFDPARAGGIAQLALFRPGLVMMRALGDWGTKARLDQVLLVAEREWTGSVQLVLEEVCGP